MPKIRWSCCAGVMLYGVGLLSLVPEATASNLTSRPAIAVENFTRHEWVGRYFTDKASPRLWAALNRRTDVALYAQTFAFEGKGQTYCVAHVGLTHAAPRQDLHPRSPARLHWAAASQPAAATDRKPCTERALVRALDQLAADDTAVQEESLLNQSRFTPGDRLREGTDEGRVHSQSFGVSTVGQQYVVDQLPPWFSRAFDYRRTQVRIMLNHLIADDGHRVCFGYLGLTARAPDGQTPRLPLAWDARARLFDPGRADLADRDSECFDPIFDALTAAVRPDSPLVTTFIDRFAAVAEPDLPAPSRADVARGVARSKQQLAQVEREAAARAPARPVATRQQATQYNTCQVSCINGDCRRTWPDGRSERFQAPRRFNPFTNQWEWDTSGC